MTAFKKALGFNSLSISDGELFVNTTHPLYKGLDQLMRWGLLPSWIGLEWVDIDDINIPF